MAQDEKHNHKKEEEEQISQAYENISKRLESIRQGKDPDAEEDEAATEKSEPDEQDDKEELAEPEEEVREEKVEEKDEVSDEEDPEEEDEDENKEDVGDKEPEEEKEVAEDEEALEEAEEESHDDEQPPVKAKEEEDEEPLEPLPGTDEDEEEDETPKPTFTPAKNDPLDEEEVAEDDPQPDRGETDDFEKEDDLSDLAKEEVPSDEPPRRSLSDYSERSFDDLRSVKPRETGAFGSEISFSKPNVSESSRPDNYFNRHTSDAPPRRGNLLHLIILILIGLAVIGGTVYLLKYQFNPTPPSPTPAPTPEATLAPTPQPTPSFDRSKFKVRVLNGTTTAGLAKTVSDKLKGLGYQIDKTGNAPKQDYKTAEIKVKSSATGLADQLKTDLAPDYSTSASASGSLKDSDAADAEVILGK